MHGRLRRGGGGAPAGVVHVLHARNGRTIAEVVDVLAAQMADLGHRVTIVAAVCTNSAGPVPAGVEVVDLGGSSRATVVSVLALRRTLAALRPAVVFAHGNGPIRAAVMATYGLRLRPRLIGIEHNHYSSYPWNARFLRGIANRVLLPRADVIVGVSQGVVDDLADTFPRLRGKLALVPSPLTRMDRLTELAAEGVEHPWFDDDVPIITSVGHVHARKDHRTLVRAMARVREVAGPRAARLVIVGNDGGDEARAVRQLIGELGLEDYVELVGLQANPLRFVARSQVFALSSRNEGMSIAILEAMALGIPVVSTDCLSGPSWLLEDGAHGLLVPVGDASALGDSIVHLLEDDLLRQRLGASGQRRAAAFIPRAVAQSALELASIRTSPKRQPAGGGRRRAATPASGWGPSEGPTRGQSGAR